MIITPRRTVCFLTAILPHYRAPFHERVRSTLAEDDIEYQLIYGQPSRLEQMKSDTVSVKWARRIKNFYLAQGPGAPVWQPALIDLLQCDLAIVGQENRLLVNYPIIALRHFTPVRLAFWGHGRNHQARSSKNLRERWKRAWSTSSDWWFGYTDAVRADLLAAGYPEERITVVNNSIDTTALKSLRDDVSAEEVARLKSELDLHAGWTAVFVGGLYDHKRLPFLIDACDRIARRQARFRLVVAGGGVLMAWLHAAAAGRPWLKVLKPTFGREKAKLMMVADVYVMPGLVGLGVLDSSVFSLPIVTTAYPAHSPEFAYVKDGESAVIVADWESAEAYADALQALLEDDGRRLALSRGALELATTYSIDEMARRFCEGAVSALEAPKLRS